MFFDFDWTKIKITETFYCRYPVFYMFNPELLEHCTFFFFFCLMCLSFIIATSPTFITETRSYLAGSLDLLVKSLYIKFNDQL
jgi:hypothetical protein